MSARSTVGTCAVSTSRTMPPPMPLIMPRTAAMGQLIPCSSAFWTLSRSSAWSEAHDGGGGHHHGVDALLRHRAVRAAAEQRHLPAVPGREHGPGAPADLPGAERHHVLAERDVR